MLTHVTRILSEGVVLLTALVKLFSDTRIASGPPPAGPLDAEAPLPPPPPPPLPPAPSQADDAVARTDPVLLLMSLAFSVICLITSILATGGVVQVLGNSTSVVSSGTSVWSRVGRGGQGGDRATSMLRHGLAALSGTASRVAPQPPRNGALV